MKATNDRELLRAVVDGDRLALARALTLIESTRPDHAARARALVDAATAHGGKAVRLGITGVPGVGKSTFIEQLGTRLLDAGKRVAVLAIDPSSTRTGGSILGDKTRMPALASDRRAFVRPSPSAGVLGGVARMTRETMVLVEAAGHDVVIVETVGVGQSETLVADMVDCFVVLMMPATGDELQGIKKGILELADIIVVNKADGELLAKAELAKRQYANALSLLKQNHPQWHTPALLASAIERRGLDELWRAVEEHRDIMMRSGMLEAKRIDQRLSWFDGLIHDQIRQWIGANEATRSLMAELEQQIRANRRSPYSACLELMTSLFGDRPPHSS